VNCSEFNPLRQELARGRQDEPHPDSDVLTAFSEGALLQGERQQVLAHLSACADCREVLSLATTAAIDSADDLKSFILTRKSLPPRRAWLPWASITASLLVVCTAVLVYQQKMATPKSATVATKEAVQLPSPTIQQPPLLPQLKGPESHSKMTNSQRSSQLQVPLPSQNMAVANVISERPIEAAKKSDLGQQSSYQSSTPAGEIATLAATAQKTAPTKSFSAFVNDSPARALSNASIASAARSHWRINSLGQPERSFGDGVWQAILPHEQSRMRVVSVFDNEVWIGGDSSRLYHSTDNGATWNLITLPDNDGREHSIAHIHFQTAQSGTVESDDGTVWITSDGGRTWE
jgi:hypothetical protein